MHVDTYLEGLHASQHIAVPCTVHWFLTPDLHYRTKWLRLHLAPLLGSLCADLHCRGSHLCLRPLLLVQVRVCMRLHAQAHVLACMGCLPAATGLYSLSCHDAAHSHRMFASHRRAKVNPRAGFGDLALIAVSFTILANIFSIVVFKVSLNLLDQIRCTAPVLLHPSSDCALWLCGLSMGLLNLPHTVLQLIRAPQHSRLELQDDQTD